MNCFGPPPKSRIQSRKRSKHLSSEEKPLAEMSTTLYGPRIVYKQKAPGVSVTTSVQVPRTASMPNNPRYSMRSLHSQNYQYPLPLPPTYAQHAQDYHSQIPQSACFSTPPIPPPDSQIREPSETPREKRKSHTRHLSNRLSNISAPPFFFSDPPARRSMSRAEMKKAIEEAAAQAAVAEMRKQTELAAAKRFADATEAKKIDDAIKNAISGVSADAFKRDEEMKKLLEGSRTELEALKRERQAEKARASMRKEVFEEIAEVGVVRSRFNPEFVQTGRDHLQPPKERRHSSKTKTSLEDYEQELARIRHRQHELERRQAEDHFNLHRKPINHSRGYHSSTNTSNQPAYTRNPFAAHITPLDPHRHDPSRQHADNVGGYREDAGWHWGGGPENRGVANGKETSGGERRRSSVASFTTLARKMLERLGRVEKAQEQIDREWASDLARDLARENEKDFARGFAGRKSFGF